VLFNSYSHFDSFFETLPGFLRQMPEYRPWWVVDAIRSKSGVQHPGCRFAPDVRPGEACAEAAGEPLIVWNHRWEFDKDPAAFFRVLARAGQAGARFRLALMGENFQVVPGEFIAARKRWAERIVQYGYVESRQEYYDLLGSGAVVVSTALQENFGISVVEAVRHGCLPLLPHRLSYPELLPEELHAHFLYRNEDDLVEKLVTILGDLGSGNDRWAGPVSAAVRHMGRFSWACRIDDFDREIARSAG
jgi:glycosyltransferase involved in cell wall biosynthesis